jgi:hypothetical protein
LKNAEGNQEIATNSTTTTTTPPISPDEETTTQQEQEQPVEEFPPTPFPLLGSFTVTFNEPGTYEYFCAFHPGMYGIVTVAGGEEGEAAGEEAEAAEQEGGAQQQQQTTPTLPAPNPLFE